MVGAGAGGENDRIARAIEHALSREHLVESMTVLNRPGATQTIAINYLASKKGDTHTIGLASGSFINAIARSGSTLHKNITPLMKLFDAYQCYFTRIESPIKTMADLSERLHSDPRSLTFAFPIGRGSPLHISAVKVAKAAGAGPNDIVTVIYNSGSDVAAQVAGGHVDIGITSIGSAMPLIAAARLRMLGNHLARAHRRRLGKLPHAARAGLRRHDRQSLHGSGAERACAGAAEILDRRDRQSS